VPPGTLSGGGGAERTRARPVGKAASPVDEAAPRCVHCREDLLSAGKEHHFGCPVYVLNKDIQDEKKAKRWIDVTRIGINLGPSPRHASSVALILNLKSGLVSPQFHCQYDDLFESTTGTQARSMPQSLWQQKCGFSLNHNSEDDGDTARQSEPTKVTTNISLKDELSTLSIQDDIPSP
jgi:hypothetical protein